jgi:hypothetical protein
VKAILVDAKDSLAKNPHCDIFARRKQRVIGISSGDNGTEPIEIIGNPYL